jgi:hypothetical protein
MIGPPAGHFRWPVIGVGESEVHTVGGARHLDARDAAETNTTQQKQGRRGQGVGGGGGGNPRPAMAAIQGTTGGRYGQPETGDAQ